VSLIGDALRKARQEAAVQGERGPAPPPPLTATPRRGGLGLGLVIGASIALVAGLVGGIAVFWAIGAREAPQAASASPTPVTALSVPAAPTPVPQPAATPVPGVTPAAQQPLPVVTAIAEPGEPPLSPPEAEPVPTQRAAHPAVAGGERSFALEANLGYATLSLGYVVYRSVDPFAEVNGIEVHVGSVVDGFQVEEITRTSVRLRDAKGPVTLRVK